MTDWRAIVSIIALGAAFLLSPLLFPENPEISKHLMYAWFAAMGLGIGPPAIRRALGKDNGNN